MKNGWYILNYHNISWEETPYIRGIGGSLPPDIFRDYLEELNKHFKFVSIQEGFKQYRSGKIKEPLISFWFDDGLTGVRKYAFPLLEGYNVKGAMSISSKFMLREELYWRFKLSFISQVDGMRFLRSKLRKYGYKIDLSVKRFVMNSFSEEIVELIDSVYNVLTKEYTRKDAYRLFDDINGIKKLHNNGWEIANHSANHYPIGEDTYIHKLKDEFEECEKTLNKSLNVKTKYWVLPFDRDKHRSCKLIKDFTKLNDANRYLVLVGNKVNINYDNQGCVIFRIVFPLGSVGSDRKDIVKHLEEKSLHF